MQKWLQLILAILGEAEQIVPIFIHNPKSQQIEGIVVTTVNAAVNTLAPALVALGQPPAPPAPPAV